MKKWLTSGLVLTCILCLAGCGSSSRSYSDNGTGFEISNSAPAKSMVSFSEDADVYVTGGDYSSTTITGDKADYSYNFQAGGETKKSKAEMLADYEHIQDFVNERDGFIENVYNDYQYYEADNYSSYNRNYISRGNLSFTIEIDNDDVLDVLAELEKICIDNKFTVTNYTQRIQNYQNFRVVDEYSDEVYYGQAITQDELDRRLNYADITVNLSYRNPRAKVAVFFLQLRDAIEDFWDNCGEILQIILVIVVVIFAIFAEIMLLYKMFIKMMYKHRQKHPNYYPPKGIYIVSQQELSSMVKPIEPEQNKQ